MTIVQKIQSLITAANAKTGESDTTLTDAVQTLVDGYGQGGGGVTKNLIGSGTYTVATTTQNATIPILYSGTPNEVLVTKDELDAGVGETIAWVMITDGAQNTLDAFPLGVKMEKIKINNHFIHNFLLFA